MASHAEITYLTQILHSFLYCQIWTCTLTVFSWFFQSIHGLCKSRGQTILCMIKHILILCR